MAHTAVGIAENIIDHLGMAFGGLSQVPDRVVGAAIFGRHNNGGDTGVSPDDVMQAASGILAEHWGEDVPVVRARIKRIKAGFMGAGSRAFQDKQPKV
jgi:hypothetical protein